MKRNLFCVCCVLRLSRYGASIPSHSRVGIFPIHLDPPTVEHRALFQLLLGQVPLRTLSPHHLEHSPQTHEITLPSPPGSSHESLRSTSSLVDPSISLSSASTDEQDGLCEEEDNETNYMQEFATSLTKYSRLVPFDELIIIPNTKFPVTLSNSVHLAALSVLGTRGIAHLHVDFTALEHPDDTMPVVAQLVQKYRRSCVVHWLHDAYEMQTWTQFEWMKQVVPLLLLKTQDHNASQSTAPSGTVTPLTSTSMQQKASKEAVRDEPREGLKWWRTPPTESLQDGEVVEVSKWYLGSLETSWLGSRTSSVYHEHSDGVPPTSASDTAGVSETHSPPNAASESSSSAGETEELRTGSSAGNLWQHGPRLPSTPSSSTRCVGQLLDELYPWVKSPFRTHQKRRRRTPANVSTEKSGRGSSHSPSTAVSSAPFYPDEPTTAAKSRYSPSSLPYVEVFALPRHSGAEVRHLLWDQVADEARPLLTKTVWHYVTTHGLYHNVRRWAAAAAASILATTDSGLPDDDPDVMESDAASSRFYPPRSRGVPAFSHPATAVGPPSSSVSGKETAAQAVRGESGLVFHQLRRSKKPFRAALRSHAHLHLQGLVPRLELHHDTNNPLARECYEGLKVFQCPENEDPDLIVPIGGDGYMMTCIRQHWKRFIPFYGVNAGHVGHLLNAASQLHELFAFPLNLYAAVMLYCQCEQPPPSGAPHGTPPRITSELAFNDAWVERSSGQTAQIKILVNGEERIHKLKGDGVLVSTAAGSTAYSRALGASPVPIGAPLIQIVGSNVVSPAQWRPAHLEQEDEVELVVLDREKRPCRGFVDAVEVGDVTRMLIRCSRVAGVTLAYSQSCDLQSKLYDLQFPCNKRAGREYGSR